MLGMEWGVKNKYSICRTQIYRIRPVTKCGAEGREKGKKVKIL